MPTSYLVLLALLQLPSVPVPSSEAPDLKTVLLLLGGIAWFIREMYPVFNKPASDLPPMVPATVMMTIREQVLPILARQTEILGALQAGQQQQRDHEIHELGILENIEKGIDAVRATTHTIVNTENVMLGTLQQVQRSQERS